MKRLITANLESFKKYLKRTFDNNYSDNHSSYETVYRGQTKNNTPFFINEVNNEFIILFDTNDLNDDETYNRCEEKMIEYFGQSIRYESSTCEFVVDSEVKLDKLFDMLDKEFNL